MVIKRKKKLNVKTRTRDLIIEESERMIGEYGIDGLRLDDIADTLGVRRASLYTHFDGRDGILTDVAERAFVLLSRQFQDDEELSPSDVIERGVHELVSFLSEHKAYARILARDISTPEGLPYVNKVLGSTKDQKVPILLEPLYSRLRDIIQRGNELGCFREMDEFLFFTIILGATMAALLQHRREIKKLDKKMAEVALDILSK